MTTTENSAQNASSAKVPTDPEDFPRIVSVDDHVVEPPHLFDRWLPKKFQDHPDKPRIERRGLAGMKYLGGTKYDFDWQDDAPKADCWIYGDLIAPHKRHVAAVGFSRDEMTASPITYDEMRDGCYDPKARVEDMEMDGVDSSLCFPTFATILWPDVCRGRRQGTRDGVPPGVQQLDGRGVVW